MTFVTCFGRIGRARSHPKSWWLGEKPDRDAALRPKNRENNRMQSS